MIREIIEREYLKPTRSPVRRVLEEIRLACRRHGWSAPTRRTIVARLSMIDQRVRAVRRGDTRAVRSLNATPGEYTATLGDCLSGVDLLSAIIGHWLNALAITVAAVPTLAAPGTKRQVLSTRSPPRGVHPESDDGP